MSKLEEFWERESRICGLRPTLLLHRVQLFSSLACLLPPSLTASIPVSLVIVKIVPVKHGHKLRITWAMTPGIHHYMEGTSRYLGHLIGHAREGSLFYFLKKLGWGQAYLLLSAIREMTFHYQDKIPPIDYVVKFSSNTQLYPSKDWLVGSSLPSTFSLKLSSLH
uniref:Uncharacterized protein n=1 Tax=Lactuca sativa TaxID=4236 RepID=A0A9R1V8T0_LACSA|nr:hypothetical protein LSAT_V11C600303710 [Lactuca sativa]